MITMDGNELIRAIGLPLKDKKVIDILKQTNSGMPSKGYYAPNVFNLEAGITFSFNARYSFERAYLEPPYLTLDKPFPRPPFENPDDEVCELMLEKIDLVDEFKTDLPFGLSFDGDNSEFIKQGKPYKKIKYSKESSFANYANCYLRGIYQIELQYNCNDKLVRVQTSLISNETRKYLRRKETLREQNKNINPELSANLITFKNPDIICSWKSRMAEGDDCFSNENIEATNIILNDFIDQMAIATQEKKASKILNTVKKVVNALNKINNKYNHIETMEREELCEFIFSAVKATGYVLDENEDITYEWREW